MADRYLRRSEVEHQTGISRSTIYRRMHDGTFHAPFNLGGNCVQWRDQDLVEWKQSHPRAFRAPVND